MSLTPPGSETASFPVAFVHLQSEIAKLNVQPLTKLPDASFSLHTHPQTARQTHTATPRRLLKEGDSPWASRRCMVRAVPSSLHEGLVRLFQDHPGLAAVLLRDVLALDLPVHRGVRNDSSSFSELQPPEYRADVFTILDGEDKPAMAIIVEVQLAIKEKKRRTWLGYTATSIAQLGCDACVLVVTPDESVARWAKQPLEFGLGSMFRPLVIGPEEMPAITEAKRAKADPYLAVLSAVAHGHDKDSKTASEVASVAWDAARQLADDVLYFDLIKSSLSEAARKAFEMLPQTYRFQDEALRKSFDKGTAKAVLRVLDRRNIALSSEQRERIDSCTDANQLERWLDRAVVAHSAAEVFTEE